MMDEIKKLRLAIEQGEIGEGLFRGEDAERIAALFRAERQKREQAENALQDSRRFLSRASHDLRQPLQAAGLFAMVLASGETTEKQKDLIEKIEQSLSGVDRYVEALLEISRLDSGTIKAFPAAFLVQSLLDRLEGEFRGQAEQKGLSLIVVPCSALAFSDQHLVEKIMIRLLSNAVRYTSAGKILVGARRSGGAVSLEVSDTGCGFPEDRAVDIFTPFNSFGGERKSGDVGLGLATAQRIARLLGLDLRARGQAGRGATFALTIPVALDPGKKDRREKKIF